MYLGSWWRTCVIVSLSLFRLLMIARQGTFVEFSVFGKETTADWTFISDAKGQSLCVCVCV